MRRFLKFPAYRVWAVLSTLTVLVMLPGSVQADFPAKLSLNGENLSLAGAGARKKAFIGVYDAALYLSGSTDSADRIVAADEAMAVSIEITSRLISARKLSSALQEGFSRATGGDTAAIDDEIADFQTAFQDPVEKGDRFDLVYSPGAGVQVYRNGQPDVVVTGLAFKQALFAIWLGRDPVQDSLKQAMLGR